MQSSSQPRPFRGASVDAPVRRRRGGSGLIVAFTIRTCVGDLNAAPGRLERRLTSAVAVKGRHVCLRGPIGCLMWHSKKLADGTHCPCTTYLAVEGLHRNSSECGWRGHADSSCHHLAEHPLAVLEGGIGCHSCLRVLPDNLLEWWGLASAAKYGWIPECSSGHHDGNRTRVPIHLVALLCTRLRDGFLDVFPVLVNLPPGEEIPVGDDRHLDGIPQSNDLVPMCRLGRPLLPPAHVHRDRLRAGGLAHAHEVPSLFGR
mmetsp:Transcript_11407/g.40470  ORF Transcript_11407/g.40470 Transcript_11407/m.40470 type:complete len:259 (-) Transcript_11407:620-1396(-)